MIENFKNLGRHIKKVLDIRNSEEKKNERIRFREMTWGVYDEKLWHFGATFVSSLPEEYKAKGWDGFKLYIEKNLSKMENIKPTAVELGGPGSELFRGFSKGFFQKTIGVCLSDIRGPDEKLEDSELNHEVITGDILNQTEEILNRIKILLGANKTDLIISRMVGALNLMDIKALDSAIRKFYSLLKDNGIMFVQYNYSSTDIKKEDKIAEKCVQAIKEKYPQLDIQSGRGVIRLNKKSGAPDELPEDIHFFT